MGGFVLCRGHFSNQLLFEEQIQEEKVTRESTYHHLSFKSKVRETDSAAIRRAFDKAGSSPDCPITGP